MQHLVRVLVLYVLFDAVTSSTVVLGTALNLGVSANSRVCVPALYCTVLY